MAFRSSPQLRNLVADMFAAYIFGTSGFAGAGGSKLQIYNGTQPGTGGNGTTGCTMIAEISGISWSTSTSGTAALASTSYTATAGTNGTATWARLIGSSTSGTAYCFDSDCGTSSTKGFVIDSEIISAGDVITLTGASFVGPSST